VRKIKIKPIWNDAKLLQFKVWVSSVEKKGKSLSLHT